jgi:hypothetical protein
MTPEVLEHKMHSKAGCARKGLPHGKAYHRATESE